jgi:hypothetical protein
MNRTLEFVDKALRSTPRRPTGETANEFDAINRFNEYASAHPSELASLLTDAANSDSLVKGARGLGFALSLDRVQEYVRSASSRTSHEATDYRILNAATVTLAHTATSGCIASTSVCVGPSTSSSGAVQVSTVTNVNASVIGIAVAAVTVY